MAVLRSGGPPGAKTEPILGRPWVIGALAVCAICLLLSVLFFDRPIAEWVDGFRPRLRGRAEWLSQIGNGWVPIVLLPSIYIVTRFLWRHRILSDWALFAAISQITSSVILHTFKIVLGRARPRLYLHEDIYDFDFFRLDAVWRAFPSGHATTIMALAVAASVLLPRYALIILPFGVAVGLMRVASNAHYLGDVLAGFFLAALVTSFWADFLRDRGWRLSFG